MDLARVELLKNEKIFSIPRQMAVERDSSCAGPLSDDRNGSDGQHICHDNSEPYRGSDILLGGQKNI